MDELFYRTDTPLENVLEASVACQRFSRLTPAQFDDHRSNFSSTAPESPGRLPRYRSEIDLTALSEELPDNADLLSDENDAPVIRLINAVLHEAVREGASDVHIETFEKSLVVRFRIDGVLKPVLQPAKKLAPLLISRIKVMARLDIAENDCRRMGVFPCASDAKILMSAFRRCPRSTAKELYCACWIKQSAPDAGEYGDVAGG